MMLIAAAMLLAQEAVAAPAPPCAVKGNRFSAAVVCPGAPPATLTIANVGQAVSGRWSGLVIDASTVQLASTPVGPGEPLLRVKVRQGFSARLATRFQGRGMGGAALEPGELVFGSNYHLSIVDTRTHAEMGGSRDVFLWCAPVALSKDAAAHDRTMCFVDSAKPFVLGVGLLKMDVNKSYYFVMSKKGESANAPAALAPATTMGVRKPVAEPTREPYPEAFDLVISWRRVGETDRLVAEAVDSGGRSPIDFLPLHSTDPVDLFGGKLELNRGEAGWTARFVSPPTEGAVVAFSPDLSAR